MATAKATLESKRNEHGFHPVGNSNGIPIYVSTKGANASQSADRTVEPNLALPAYQFLLPALSSDFSLRGKFNDNGKSDTCFWIAGTGRDTNHLVTESQEPEITASQEAEIFRLAESGMKYTVIARKLDLPAVGVYYALKKKGSKRTKAPKKPRTSTLCTFDKQGNLVVGKGDSLETTVRVSKGAEDDPLLFFVLRDSYSQVGGARFVLATCNGRQFTTDFMARVVVGVPHKSTQSQVQAGLLDAAQASKQLERKARQS
ncbi:MAG: hypothetical protein ACYC7D_07410 [Nitrososphaerales archaeon]